MFIWSLFAFMNLSDQSSKCDQDAIILKLLELLSELEQMHPITTNRNEMLTLLILCQINELRYRIQRNCCFIHFLH